MNPLALEEHKFYHPSKDKWQVVPGRPSAWRLNPNSYIWVPSYQLFEQAENQPFPKEFTLFVTVRIYNVSPQRIPVADLTLDVSVHDGHDFQSTLPATTGHLFIFRVSWS